MDKNNLLSYLKNNFYRQIATNNIHVFCSLYPEVDIKCIAISAEANLCQLAGRNPL